MKVLVVNSGSSTLKFRIIDTKNEVTEIKGAIEKIGEKGAFYEFGKSGETKFACENHGMAIRKMFELLGDIKIDCIGHRVVHGGEKWTKPVVATEKVLLELDKISYLAPLHNPANILGVRECMKIMPAIRNVLVFDTAFHSTMPRSAFLYGLAYEDYQNYGIRKYGFHGTSHGYVSREAAKVLNKPIEQLKIVTCHIGSGASICAVDGGKSVDTSMGFTPLAGVVMGTRCGDLDVSVVPVLCKKHKFSVDECLDYLNKKCGLLGLFGKSNDMRDIEREFGKNERAEIAVSVFVNSLVKYIGAFIAEMGGCDAIVWTGGVGVNRPWIVDMAMTHFDYLPNVKRLVIPTNEELEIAMECNQILK